MSHLAIYRKYRPSNFEDVSGQKTIVNILKNAIISNNVSHAYLFTGPRGTGKTSIAKIFARTINCECLNNGNPCNRCSFCNNSLSKECVDIIEIDAASNNGVDEIRELKSKINIVPTYLKYKVYIIDEVHMLSIGAFNALLKTLEEPPSHVIFILATTEIQKIPSTILSRCQILEFKKVSPIDMKNRISYICEQENIKIEESAVDEIISVSDGCVRDALSLLEKINAYCDKIIREEDVRLVVGKPPKHFIEQMIDCFIECDIHQIVEKINEAYIKDYEMIYVVEDIINELDKIIFKKSLRDVKYQSLLSKMVCIYDRMKNSFVSPKIIFEIEMLDYCDAKNDKNISREIFLKNEEIIKPNSVEQIDEEKEVKEVNNNVCNINEEEFKKIRINNTFAGANRESLTKIRTNWNTFNDYAFDKENGALICSLLDGVPVAASKDYLILSYQYQTETTKINNNYKKIEKTIEKYLSLSYKIVAITKDEWEKAKQEYVNKINSKEPYKVIQDTYIDNGLVLTKENQKNEKEVNNLDSIDAKIFELFDSKDIEVK